MNCNHCEHTKRPEYQSTPMDVTEWIAMFLLVGVPFIIYWLGLVFIVPNISKFTAG